MQTNCALRNFLKFFLWLFVTFYTNFFKLPDFVWVFITCPAENILFPGFSDRMNPVLVKMRLSYRTISPKRCIVTYFWVNWVFNWIICLIVSRLGSTILWKLMKFCKFWKVFWNLKVSQLFLFLGQRGICQFNLLNFHIILNWFYWCLSCSKTTTKTFTTLENFLKACIICESSSSYWRTETGRACAWMILRFNNGSNLLFVS